MVGFKLEFWMSNICILGLYFSTTGSRSHSEVWFYISTIQFATFFV